MTYGRISKKTAGNTGLHEKMKFSTEVFRLLYVRSVKQ